MSAATVDLGEFHGKVIQQILEDSAHDLQGVAAAEMDIHTGVTAPRPETLIRQAEPALGGTSLTLRRAVVLPRRRNRCTGSRFLRYPG